jgi:PAS domain S-box-containing protein
MENAIAIGVISTHSDLTSMCRQLGDMPGYKLMVYEGALANSLPGLQHFEKNGVEVIVSTRGNNLFIKDHTKIPVIAVPENRFDIFSPLARVAKRYGPKVTIFFYREYPEGFNEITEILGFEPDVRVFQGSSHLEVLLEELQGSDRIIVGGGYVCQTASAQGFITEQVNRSRESLVSALETAKELAMVRRQERKESFRLQAILDWAHEGIIATDENGLITLFNKAAEKIFGLRPSEVLNRNSQKVLSNAKLHEVIGTTEASIGQIIQIGNAAVAANRVPIVNDGHISGMVATFQPVKNIQEIEEKIRRELIPDTKGNRYNFSDIKGHSRAIQATVELAGKYADTDEAVLILGGSGTGKELFAQSIHGASKRMKKPFLAVNCAAIPGNLLESELFGYSEGAFTGARKGGKPGLFELAHGGSLFLDEIGDMPVDIQAKLLRVIQEKEVRRVGGENLVRVDVLIIAATHQNLLELVAAGKFREDLFYRLDVLRLNIPPLVDRKEDIPHLTMGILNRISDLSSKQKRAIVASLSIRSDYDWPGNVRELENIVRRLAVLTNGLCEPEARAVARQALSQFCGGKVRYLPQNNSHITLQLPVNCKLKEIIAKTEKEVIQQMVLLCGGDRARAARSLGIGRTTLWRKSSDDSVLELELDNNES